MSAVSAKPAADNDLRARRRLTGISQQRIAELAECSVSAVRLLEGGWTPTTSAVRDRVMRVLDALEAGGGLTPLAGGGDPQGVTQARGRSIRRSAP